MISASSAGLNLRRAVRAQSVGVRAHAWEAIAGRRGVVRLGSRAAATLVLARARVVPRAYAWRGRVRLVGH